MYCENCNEQLTTHWCEDCYVEWFAYNNPSVLNAAVWPVAEPPAEEPAPPPATGSDKIFKVSFGINACNEVWVKAANECWGSRSQVPADL